MAMFKCSGALFNGTIVINTTANATVTATTSGTTRTFTAVANASGVANIRVKKRGTYAIASTGTTRVGHAVVSSNTPVTAYYNWSKYNAYKSYYSYLNQSCGAGGSIYISGSRGNGLYGAPTFDSATGLWGADNIASGYILDQSMTDLNRQHNLIDMTQNSSSPLWTSNHYVYCSNSAFYLERNWFRNTYYSGGGIWEYYSAYTWNKGSYIEDVTATTLNAHTEGYNSDGYWYVAA